MYSAGYMKRAYWYYIFFSLFTFFGLLACVLTFLFSNSIWLQLITVIAFTFFRMQVGFIGHDLSHNQVFKSKAKNKFFAYIAWSLVSGMSQDYWDQKHNRHHEHTNQDGADPDLELPFIFAPEHHYVQDWLVKKVVVPYQHILFFLAMPFVYILIVYESYKYAVKTRAATSWYELILMTTNILAVVILLVYVQWLLLGLLFVLIHFLLAGVYMSLSFAPNHYWKEVIPEDEEYQRVFQITTSRNLYPSWIGTFLFGGLDYQIEHHLYPTMPRKNYRKVGPMVKAFCKKHNIEYTETSLLGSMGEIYTSLKQQAKV